MRGWQSSVPSGGARGDSVSLIFPASRSCPHSLTGSSSLLWSGRAPLCPALLCPPLLCLPPAPETPLWRRWAHPEDPGSPACFRVNWLAPFLTCHLTHLTQPAPRFWGFVHKYLWEGHSAFHRGCRHLVGRGGGAVLLRIPKCTGSPKPRGPGRKPWGRGGFVGRERM